MVRKYWRSSSQLRKIGVSPPRTTRNSSWVSERHFKALVLKSSGQWKYHCIEIWSSTFADHLKARGFGNMYSNVLQCSNEQCPEIGMEIAAKAFQTNHQHWPGLSRLVPRPLLRLVLSCKISYPARILPNLLSASKLLNGDSGPSMPHRRSARQSAIRSLRASPSAQLEPDEVYAL